MNDDEMLAAVRTEAGPCPACGRAEAKPILWGYPNVIEYDRLGDRVSWAGCCLPEDPPAHVCSACGEEYGRA